MSNLNKINSAYKNYINSNKIMKKKYEEQLIEIIGLTFYFYAYKSRNIGYENASEFYLNSSKIFNKIINNYSKEKYNIDFATYIYSVIKKLEVCFIRDDVKKKKIESACNYITFNESDNYYKHTPSIEVSQYKTKEKIIKCNKAGSNCSVSSSYNLICLYIAKNYNYLSNEVISDIVSSLPVKYKIKLVSMIEKLKSIREDKEENINLYNKDIKKGTEYYVKSLIEKIEEQKNKERKLTNIINQKNIDYYSRMHKTHLHNALFHKKVNYEELSKVSDNKLNSLGAYITTAKKILRNTKDKN